MTEPVAAAGAGPSAELNRRAAEIDPARLAAWICIPLLTLPIAVFAATWLRPLIGLPVILSLAALSWRARRLFAFTGEGAALSRGGLAAILIFTVLAVVITGVGGYVPYQSSDWDKHNLVIELLIRDPWPFTVSLDARQFTLAYHTAYHLLPALAGKAGGWPATNLVLFVQTSLGVAGAASRPGGDGRACRPFADGDALPDRAGSRAERRALVRRLWQRRGVVDPPLLISE